MALATRWQDNFIERGVMPIVREFIYNVDEDTGEEGLQPVWFANATPTRGSGAAHDILEHFTKQAGPVEGELEAIGASLAIRWEHGWGRSHGVLIREEDVMANSVSGVLTDILRDDLELPCFKRSRALPEEHDWADAVIQLGVRKGLERARREEPTADMLQGADLEEALVAWTRQGYRKAQRRYRGIDLYTLGNILFDRVAKQVDKLLASEYLNLGDRVRVSLSPRAASVGLRVNGDCAYEHGYL
jgi:hypothetical protein